MLELWPVSKAFVLVKVLRLDTVYTANGRKRKTLYGKTRIEVAAKLAQSLSDRESGLIFDAQSQTVGGYLDRRLNDSVKDTTVRQSTSRGTSG